MTNGGFFKNVLEKRYFLTFFEVKKRQKAAFFEHIFEKSAISHDLGWTNDSENFESMSRGFFISSGLIISLLFASGGRKNCFFVSGGGSWNNYLHMMIFI